MSNQTSLFATDDTRQPDAHGTVCTHPAGTQFLNRDLFTKGWNVVCGATVNGAQCGAIIASGYQSPDVRG